MDNLILLTDMTEVASLPTSAVNLLKVTGIIPKNNHNAVSFCGVVIDKSKTYVFLPREVDISSVSLDDSFKYSALLMRTIEMYARESLNFVNSEEHGDMFEHISSLGLVKQILENYLHNGLYQQKKKQTQINNGKTCWQTTISKSFPVFNNLKQPIYTELFGKRFRYNYHNVIAQIQASIIRDLDRRFSWLLTGKKGLLAPELHDIEGINKSKDWQIIRLKQEKQSTYSQAELNTISALISYLENSSFTGSFCCGLTKFHYTWEHMIYKVLPNTFDLNSQLPSPTYVKSSGEYMEDNRKGMRTDVALHHPDIKKVIIVDAKYYAVSKGNLPGWHDLVKQFYYVKSARLIFPDDYVFSNIFLFPGAIGAVSSAIIKNPKNNDAFNNEFPPIYCFYQCPLKLMESYVTGTELHSLYNSLLEAEIS